jgi:GTPase SAR1 family protein
MEEDKTLVTREWLYTKILDASQKKYYGKLCGLVLAGGSGAGKSTFCKQLQEEKASSRKHTLLRNKMIASYICPNKKLCSGSYVVQFLHSIYSQLTESPALLRFQEQKESGKAISNLKLFLIMKFVLIKDGSEKL